MHLNSRSVDLRDGDDLAVFVRTGNCGNIAEDHIHISSGGEPKLKLPVVLLESFIIHIVKLIYVCIYGVVGVVPLVIR